MDPIMLHNRSFAEAACPYPLGRRERDVLSTLLILEEDGEEDYSADDEYDMDFESSFDTSFDCERPSFDRWYSKDLPVTPSSALNRGIPNMHSPSTIRTLIVKNGGEFEEDDSDEGKVNSLVNQSGSHSLTPTKEILEGHECPPNCYLCSISAVIYKIEYPDLYEECDSLDDEDDFADCTTSAPITHCVTECISCARERLRAEGYKFPAYQYDHNDHIPGDDEAKVEEKIKPWGQRISQEEVDPQINIVFTTPPDSQKAASTTLPVKLNETFPRVFFPPPKPSSNTCV
ncbi:hypothetical protein F5876DRAFT_78143 [Lentinula aff. lateritia]|uniref:Uncharacterized protein n=1 Tax=Lentinula aff. lateritia TaxID=2804960 RepID=A0ACC1TWD9_9AGAR|nr:hypothetical protein F5876DRAFT_78143 [Lentinula aff. lateritia]